MRITTIIAAGVAATALAFGASTAAAVPITVPRIVVNDGYTVRAEGTITSPSNASTCEALVRSVLQVESSGYWRTVRTMGRWRINVCRNGDSGVTYGYLRATFTGVDRLLTRYPRLARFCWQAHQTVNGYESKHVACKVFRLPRS